MSWTPHYVRVVVAACGVSMDVLRGPSRKRKDLGKPSVRHIAMWLGRQLGYSFPAVGRHLHRDHTSVINGWRRIEYQRRINPTIRATTDALLSDARKGAQEPRTAPSVILAILPPPDPPRPPSGPENEPEAPFYEEGVKDRKYLERMDRAFRAAMLASGEVAS